MAKEVASAVSALLMLQFVAILSTGVRQHHHVVRRFLIAPAEAFVGGKVVLGIAVIAVRACPGVKGPHFF